MYNVEVTNPLSVKSLMKYDVPISFSMTHASLKPPIHINAGAMNGIFDR
jgi:hypothetical protein